LVIVEIPLAVSAVVSVGQACPKGRPYAIVP
jgi:hypothetical protein